MSFSATAVARWLCRRGSAPPQQTPSCAATAARNRRTRRWRTRAAWRRAPPRPLACRPLPRPGGKARRSESKMISRSAGRHRPSDRRRVPPRCATRAHCRASHDWRAPRPPPWRSPASGGQSSSAAMRRPKCSASTGTSPSRARSGGSVTTFEGQPIQQVRAKPPFVDQFRQMLVRRRDDAHVHPQGPRRADARHLAIFHRAQQLFLRAGGQRRQLVQEQRPPSASSKRPALARVAPVKAPASWPKSSASISVSGSAAQFIVTSGPGPARGEAMQAFGHQLLARAALADHQYGPVEPRRAAGSLDGIEKGPDWPMNWLSRSMPTGWRIFPTLRKP